MKPETSKEELYDLLQKRTEESLFHKMGHDASQSLLKNLQEDHKKQVLDYTNQIRLLQELVHNQKIQLNEVKQKYLGASFFDT